MLYGPKTHTNVEPIEDISGSLCTQEEDTQNTVWYRTKEFQQLQRDLEEAMLKLKKANDPKARRELLAEMRRLLAEADRFNQEPE